MEPKLDILDHQNHLPCFNFPWENHLIFAINHYIINVCPNIFLLAHVHDVINRYSVFFKLKLLANKHAPNTTPPIPWHQTHFPLAKPSHTPSFPSPLEFYKYHTHLTSSHTILKPFNRNLKSKIPLVRKRSETKWFKCS